VDAGNGPANKTIQLFGDEMNGFLFCFFAVLLLEVRCWVAWRNAQKGNRGFISVALLILGIPQAVFLTYVFTRIAIALFSGSQL
jgi:hypothetical protein